MFDIRSAAASLFKKCSVCKGYKWPEEFQKKRSDCRSCRSDADRFRRYGISYEEYSRRFVLQNGSCAICKTDSDEPLHVDHDHATGMVRGLLCSHCNHAIGKFKDSITSLARAIVYLDEATQDDLQAVVCPTMVHAVEGVDPNGCSGETVG